MKPPPFEYAGARSIDHALELLSSGPDARVLAGGQSLLPLLNLRLAAPELLVDIGRIAELRMITVGQGGQASGPLTIGAAVSQHEVTVDPAVRAGWPMLAAAIEHIGHPQIRHRGTVCGSLAHNDPLAELPAVAVALDASLLVRSTDGERTIAAEHMFLGPFMTALEPDELLVGVRFPSPSAGVGWSFREFAARDGDFATAGVATILSRTDGVVADPRVVLFGLGGSPQRATAIEQAIIGSADPEIDGDLGAALAQSLQPTDDVHASAVTRRDLAVTLVATSVTEAWERTR